MRGVADGGSSMLRLVFGPDLDRGRLGRMGGRRGLLMSLGLSGVSSDSRAMKAPLRRHWLSMRYLRKK